MKGSEMQRQVSRLLVVLGLLAPPLVNNAHADEPRKVKLSDGKEESVGKVAFSPDGKLLAVACGRAYAMEVELYSADTHRLIGKFGGHDWLIGDLQFTPDSKMLVSAAGRKCMVWNVEKRELAGRLDEAHSEPITTLSISPDGKQLATGSSDKSIIVWDLANQKQIGRLEGHTDKVTSVSFFPNGEKLISVGDDNTLRIWDWQANKEVFKCTVKYARTGMGVLAIKPDGKWFVTGDKEGHIVLWQIFWDPRIRLNDFGKWDLGSDRPMSISMSPNGKQVAVGTFSGQVDVISLEEQGVVAELKINAHRFPVTALAFSKSGQELASGSILESGLLIWSGLPK
ncbi:MAG TPA: WD40 repeat domain-containing protein [Gemmataceae bacterium]|jgi:WD40 repeat protein|nr:WD40 repeat domain-containing protein [Gemmataceae bacterium]